VDVDWEGTLGETDGAIEVAVVLLAASIVVSGTHVVVVESFEVVVVVVVDVTGGTQFVLLYIFKAP
jgi:hypothetical protein